MKKLQTDTKRKTRRERFEESKLLPKDPKPKINNKEEIKASHLKVFFNLLTIAGLFILVAEINIYRETMINIRMPLLTLLITGILVTPFISKLLDKYFGISNIFLQILYNIITCGSITIYAFMAINYYFPDDKEFYFKTLIIRTGNWAKGSGIHTCATPYAEVRIKNITKELPFPCDTEIEKYKFIDLYVKKGYFGYDIITGQTAVMD
jgi:hypothetical protein